MKSDYQIDFVKLPSGKIPFIKFLDSLTKFERAEILALIEEFRILRCDNKHLPSSKTKLLRDGIFELRLKHINRISRSIYFFTDNRFIIFTHGFIKKTEKTPKEEIEKAKKYREIYYKELKYE